MMTRSVLERAFVFLGMTMFFLFTGCDAPKQKADTVAIQQLKESHERQKQIEPLLKNAVVVDSGLVLLIPDSESGTAENSVPKILLEVMVEKREKDRKEEERFVGLNPSVAELVRNSEKAKERMLANGKISKSTATVTLAPKIDTSTKPEVVEQEVEYRPSRIKRRPTSFMLQSPLARRVEPPPVAVVAQQAPEAPEPRKKIGFWKALGGMFQFGGSTEIVYRECVRTPRNSKGVRYGRHQFEQVTEVEVDLYRYGNNANRSTAYDPRTSGYYGDGKK